jgi:uncharacterized protein (TIGR00297 family)
VPALPTWLWGIVLATGIAIAAYRLRALSASGAGAAALMGAVVMAAGWSWGILLIAYFVPASALSRWRAGDKLARSGDRADKPGPRDAAQVLANGGLFAAAAVAWLLWPGVTWQAVGAAALSASAADTWATEVGVLSRAQPRAILGGAVVPAGTSGGVTVLGFGGSVSAAVFTAMIVWLVRWPSAAVVASLVGGVAGSVLDSVLGAALQERRRCPTCGIDTERRVHGCGTATVATGGISWMTNDAVNALSTAAGAVLGAAAAQAMR